jgi:molecular chaperone DnaK (HSP70)
MHFSSFECTAIWYRGFFWWFTRILISRDIFGWFTHSGQVCLPLLPKTAQVRLPVRLFPNTVQVVHFLDIFHFSCFFNHCRTVTDKLHIRTFTTVADNQQTVQFPVFQGERVNCEDNTSLGEFTLAPIPPMRAGEAVLECVFEVDANGILKVTATEKTSGRSANITIANSVGKLSTGEIEKMISDAEAFKSNDEAFSKRFEAKQQLESYIGRVEEIVTDPTLSLKLKRGQKEKIEQTISEAMATLEITDSSAEDLKKQEMALKRLVTKAMSSR